MRQQSICRIFGAGTHYAPLPKIGAGDFVIAADGGYDYLLSKGVRCDVLIGDFDSFAGMLPEDIETIRLPVEKDDTDMAAAIGLGWERGFREFHLYGGTGGRLDHTLANIECIAALAAKGGRGYLYDQDTIITALTGGRIVFPANAMGTLSVFAHTDTVTGVYERGLKYSLENATLTNLRPLGVSNEFTGKASEVAIGEGIALIIYPRKMQEALA